MSDEREAGQGLDAEIAERVMGWRWNEYWCGSERIHGLFPPNGPFSHHDQQPSYSTDIAAAWLVVARMKEHAPTRFKNLSMVVYCYSRTYATFDANSFGEYDAETWAEANGEHHTPLAICLAALRALDAASPVVSPSSARRESP